MSVKENSSPDYKKIWREYERRSEKGQQKPLKIGLAGTFTVDSLVPYLGGQLIFSAGLDPDIRVAPYNQLQQLCINPAAIPEFSDVDVIAVLWRIEDLYPARLEAAAEGEASAAAELLRELQLFCDAIASLRSKFAGSLIVSTPPFPSGPMFCLADLHQPATGGLIHSQMLHEVVRRLSQIERISLLDLHAVLMLHGYAEQLDARKWYLYRQPYTESCCAHIAGQLARTIRARTTGPKKCVVVDCDNTLWGGIIGEDGLAGIELGGAFPGACFQDFQKYLLGLRGRGVFLAVASKNNAEDVFEVFDRHDAMVLKREHISAFEVHWESKVDSLKHIAERLNIGLDSLVFIDDNSRELAEVNDRLPDVTTLMVPEDPVYLPALLADSGLFDSVEITAEDRVRADMLRTEEARRAESHSLSEADFLRTLELRVNVFQVEQQHLARVTQLVNKTNQFNLMTNRYSLDEIKAMSVDENILLLGMDVADRFGAYGLVGVARLSKCSDEEWSIDDFLMSCRVLGRGAESGFLIRIADAVKLRGGRRLIGGYVVTKKNALVANFYPEHGFVVTDVAGKWVASVETVRQPGDHVRTSLTMK